MLSIGRVIDEKEIIKVAYEFEVVDGFHTSVDKCCWWSRALGRIFTLERIARWSEVSMDEEVIEGFRVELA